MLVLASAAGCTTEPTTVRTLIWGGDEQVRLPGTPLVQEVRVRTADAGGGPVARSGLPVTWKVTSGGGSLDRSDALTDVRGEASARWRLGPELGEHTLEAAIEGAEPVTFTARAVEAGPIVFTSDRTRSQWDVFAMNADGTDVVQITSSEFRDREPSWSPDGSTIIFDRVGSASPVVVAVPELQETPFAFQAEGAGSFTWSPDGELLAFSIKQDAGCARAEHNVWIVRSDGSDPRRLTHSPCGTGNRFPDWDPEGGRVAFESEEGLACCADAAAWTVGREGADAMRASRTLAYRPEWLPDGRRIAVGGFARRPSPTLRLVDAVTGEERDVWVPGDPFTYLMPGDVSPDGRYAVVEVGFRGGQADIYRVDLESGEALNLTRRRAGFDGFPSWRP